METTLPQEIIQRQSSRRPSSEDDPTREDHPAKAIHPNQATIYHLDTLIAPETKMVGYVLVGWAATGDVASNSSDQRQLSSPAPALIQRRLDDRPGRGKAPPEVSSVAKNHHHHHIHADGRKNTPLKKYQKSFEVKTTTLYIGGKNTSNLTTHISNIKTSDIKNHYHQPGSNKRTGSNQTDFSHTAPPTKHDKQ